MSRLPPALLYLTIYNPALKPIGPVAEDDEDAEEQAHILFYTARERAVSRDKMLRQVGLAKALINFSEMFSPDEACENVHSQSRRMIMFSPEPDFWIHACVELAKTPRQAAPSKVKGKGKAKGQDKDKAKAKDVEVEYDYHDGSVHDDEIRSQLLRVYEHFKLVHGSFSSILEDFGQQALELQIERFFTVWAWNWDIEQDADFGAHLGMPLHPMSKILVPLFDESASQIPSLNDTAPFILVPPYIIPSTSFTKYEHPLTLPLYLLTRIPPPLPPSPTPPKETPISTVPDNSDKSRPTSVSGFLSLGQTMDVRKWTWPGYLTFGKPGGGKGADEEVPNQEPRLKEPQADAGNDVSKLTVDSLQIDTESLHDAMSSIAIPVGEDAPQADSIETIPSLIPSPHTPLDDNLLATTTDGTPHLSADISSNTVDEGSHDTLSNEHKDSHVSSSPSSSIPSSPPSPALPNTSPSPMIPASPSSSYGTLSPPAPTPSLSSIFVYLASPNQPQKTMRQQVFYLIKDQLAFAFVARTDHEYSDEELFIIYQGASTLLTSIQSHIADEDIKANAEKSLISATKILQPKDKHIIDTGHGITVSSPDFASRSEHLYQGRQLISAPDILEVFSRTQGAQHWHIARREPGGTMLQFMEVYRKETSLVDVDNELSEVVRRFREVT